MGIITASLSQSSIVKASPSSHIRPQNPRPSHQASEKFSSSTSTIDGIPLSSSPSSSSLSAGTGTRVCTISGSGDRPSRRHDSFSLPLSLSGQLDTTCPSFPQRWHGPGPRQAVLAGGGSSPRCIALTTASRRLKLLLRWSWD